VAGVQFDRAPRVDALGHPALGIVVDHPVACRYLIPGRWEDSRPAPSASRTGRWIVVGLACFAVLAALLAGPAIMFASGGLLAASDTSCTSGGTSTAQPTASRSAEDSIPANYLALFKSIGAHYRVPWVVLAGIGKVESDFGRSTLPGVHSGANPYGAAGPMQIGIGGAAGNEWGGAPRRAA
jgi:peptidoglycan DL-endopeptidase CwlO